MSVGLVMRSPKFRIFLYIVILGVTCLTVLLLHNTHSRLKNAEISYSICQQDKEKCEQGKDSISGQLQVLYEQKKRTELLLQQERSDHRKTKEGMEKKTIETQAVHSQLEKEMNELQMKYSKLLNDFKALQDTNNQLDTQLAELKESYSVLEDEKKSLKIEVSNQIQTLHEQKELEVNKLHDQLKKISLEKEQLHHENAQQSWKLKQYESNIIVCQKQHQQLMSQFDEVSLQLNNCISGRNFSKQIPNQQQKDTNGYSQNNLLLDSASKIINRTDLKGKLLHIPEEKTLHSLEVTENSKTVEKVTEDIIGSEFNDTLTSNSSSLFVDNVNGDNRQLDMPVTENFNKTTLGGFTGLYSLSEENTSSNLTTVMHLTTTQISITGHGEKIDVDDQVPLQIPLVMNTKMDEINSQTNSQKSSAINTAKSSPSSRLLPEHSRDKILYMDKIKFNTDGIAAKKRKNVPDSHLERLMHKIKSENIIQDQVHNMQYPAFSEDGQNEIQHMKSDENAYIQRYVPFGNDINMSKLNRDENYKDDGRIENVKDADYGYDRSAINIPERQDYL